MPSLNQVQLIGNVGKVEFSVTNKGASVATITVCTDRKFTTASGEQKQDTEFHKVTCWAKLADKVKQYVEKNCLIYIDGRLVNKKWTGSDGEERYGYEVVCNKFFILHRPHYNPMIDAENKMVDEIIKSEKE